jgi:hypothetical protein
MWGSHAPFVDFGNLGLFFSSSCLHLVLLFLHLVNVSFIIMMILFIIFHKNKIKLVFIF